MGATEEMAVRRRTFDLLMSMGGLVLTVVLLVAGSLLMVGWRFAETNVRDRLAAQRIFFPPRGSEQLADPRIGPYLNQYAGQQLLTGEQALAWSDHYIAVHLGGVAGGKTYSEVSALARENPENEQLAAQAETLFRGTTLRGMLLDAYAFWKFGQIAKVAGIAAFVLAGAMTILTILGFWHLRRVSATEELQIIPEAAERSSDSYDAAGAPGNR
ncbi:MAG: hypothetical protein AB1551_06180 [Actinomycetota bacterium]